MKLENQILGHTQVKSSGAERLQKQDPINYRALVDQYGQENIENDLIVDVLTFYPKQNIRDSQGLTVTITEQDLHDIAKATNKRLEDKLKGSIYSRAKSWVKGFTIDNYDYITIQEDHDMDQEKRIGFSNGKVTVQELEGMPYLHTKHHIIAPRAKQGIALGLYREVSGTIRACNCKMQSIGVHDEECLENTIKEISYVTCPALEHAGIFSEPNHKLSPLEQVNKNKIMLQELGYIEQEKTHIQQELNLIKKEQKIEKNFNRLIQNGKVFPYQFDNYRDTMIALRDEDIERTQNILMFAEPVIKLNQNEVKNFNYMKGLVMNKDLTQTIEEIEKKGGSLVEILKAQFAEEKPKDKEDDKEEKAKLAEDEEKAKFKEFKLSAKEKGLFKEDMDEDGYKKLGEECHKYMKKFAENESINDTSKTDGDMPENAKLSEKMKEHEKKLAEYDSRQKEILSAFTRNTDTVKDLTSAVELLTRIKEQK